MLLLCLLTFRRQFTGLYSTAYESGLNLQATRQLDCDCSCCHCWFLLRPNASRSCPTASRGWPREQASVRAHTRERKHMHWQHERKREQAKCVRERPVPAVSLAAVCCCSSATKAAQFESGCLVTQLANNSECNWLIMLPIRLKQLIATRSHGEWQKLIDLRIN